MNKENGVIEVFRYCCSIDENETLNSPCCWANIEKYLGTLQGMSMTNHGKELIRQYNKEKGSFVRKQAGENFDHNVRNWMSEEKNRVPQNKQAILEFCFNYDIRSLEKVNELLYSFNYPALHLRSVDDIIWYYMLKSGESFKTANELQQKWANCVSTAGERDTWETGPLTATIQSQIDAITRTQDLERYISENIDVNSFGKIKNTAYRLLAENLEKAGLKLPETNPDKFKKHKWSFTHLEQSLSKEENSSSILGDMAGESITSPWLTISRLVSVDVPKVAADGYLSSECEQVLRIIQNATSHQLKGGSELGGFARRTTPLSRGTYLLILFLMSIKPEDYDEFAQDVPAHFPQYCDSLNYSQATINVLITLDDKLVNASFDTLDPTKRPYDRILCDCIEAAISLYFEDDCAEDHYCMLECFLRFLLDGAEGKLVKLER